MLSLRLSLNYCYLQAGLESLDFPSPAPYYSTRCHVSPVDGAANYLDASLLLLPRQAMIHDIVQRPAVGPILIVLILSSLRSCRIKDRGPTTRRRRQIDWRMTLQIFVFFLHPCIVALGRCKLCLKPNVEAFSLPLQ